MRDLFLDLLNEQPTARIFYGDQACDKPASDKGKDASDRLTLFGKGQTLTSNTSYEISEEKTPYIAIFKEKSPQEEINENLLNEHLAYLRKLTEQSKLIMAGTYATRDHEVLMFHAESLLEAAAIVEDDPLFKSGYYAKADINQVLSRMCPE
ncbi:YciI family protein [Bacillus thuringiensis]|uniref:YciI family protein n=1 Tax=Bacillus thuringiensis TaxID=1428 RepID=UPI003A899A5F